MKSQTQNLYIFGFIFIYIKKYHVIKTPTCLATRSTLDSTPVAEELRGVEWAVAEGIEDAGCAATVELDGCCSKYDEQGCKSFWSLRGFRLKERIILKSFLEQKTEISNNKKKKTKLPMLRYFPPLLFQ